MKTLALTSGLLAALLVAQSARASEQARHHCESDGRRQAMNLLRLHASIDSDESAERLGVKIENEYRVLPATRNPSDKRQRVDILEFYGFVHRGQALIRLHYLQMPALCQLGAQEIRTLGSW